MPSFPRTQIPWLPGLMALGLTAACTPSHESAIPIAQTVQDARAPGDAIRLWADAALQPALQAIARQHEERAGQRVAFTFGPSAALRQRIAQGQEADIFIAAGFTQPQQLAAGGQWQLPAAIAKDNLCLMTAPGLAVAPATALGTLLRADVRVGAYQPGSEPLGDMFWQLANRADQLQSGAHATLVAKVRILSGEQTLQGELAQGRIDAAVQGCIGAGTDAAATRLTVTPLPPAFDIGMTYTLTWRLQAPEAAYQFAQTLQAPETQRLWRATGLHEP